MINTVDTAAPTHGAVSRDTLLRRLLVPAPVFALAGPDGADGAQAPGAKAPRVNAEPATMQRAIVERVITERFQEMWQARVTQFLPWLMSMHCFGHCSGAAGLRPATRDALFLEQYLDASVERLLAERLGFAVARKDLVEVGNLAADRRGASHLLFLVMTATLHEAGFKWIVFTATRSLRNNLDKLGFPLVKLADAAPTHLSPGALADWGRYYESAPQVMAGSLELAASLMAERALPRRVLRLYRAEIAQFAATLRGEAP